jgi:hypothetical protein
MINPEPQRPVEATYPDPSPGPEWCIELAQILAEGILAAQRTREGTTPETHHYLTQARHPGAALTSPPSSLPNEADANTGVTDCEGAG